MLRRLRHTRVHVRFLFVRMGNSSELARVGWLKVC